MPLTDLEFHSSSIYSIYYTVMAAWKKACWQNFRPFINLNTAVMIIFFYKSEGRMCHQHRGQRWGSGNLSADTWRNSYALDPQLNNYKPSQTAVCNYDETKACIPLIHFAKLQQPPHRRPQLAEQPNKVVLWKNARETVNRYCKMRRASKCHWLTL